MDAADAGGGGGADAADAGVGAADAAKVFPVQRNVWVSLNKENIGRTWVMRAEQGEEREGEIRSQHEPRIIYIGW